MAVGRCCFSVIFPYSLSPPGSRYIYGDEESVAVAGCLLVPVAVRLLRSAGVSRPRMEQLPGKGRGPKICGKRIMHNLHGTHR